MREEQSRCRGNISQFENGPQCVRDLMKNYFASKIKYLMEVVAIIVKKKRTAQRGVDERGGGGMAKGPTNLSSQRKKSRKYNKVGNNFVSS